VVLEIKSVVKWWWSSTLVMQPEAEVLSQADSVTRPKLLPTTTLQGGLPPGMWWLIGVM